MTILIAYGTVEGQTKKIAKHVEGLVRDAREDVILFDTSGSSHGPSFDDVDKVILAASVHERRHPKDFETYLYSNRNELAGKRVLLLSVSLKAAFDEGQGEGQDEGEGKALRRGGKEREREGGEGRERWV